MSEFRISIPASVCVSIVAANEAAALAKVKEMSQADDGCDLPWDGSMEARLYLDGDGFSVENEQEIVCDRCDQIAVATVQTRIGEQHLCEKCQTGWHERMRADQGR